MKFKEKSTGNLNEQTAPLSVMSLSESQGVYSSYYKYQSLASNLSDDELMSAMSFCKNSLKSAPGVYETDMPMYISLMLELRLRCISKGGRVYYYTDEFDSYVMKLESDNFSVDVNLTLMVGNKEYSFLKETLPDFFITNTSKYNPFEKYEKLSLESSVEETFFKLLSILKSHYGSETLNLFRGKIDCIQLIEAMSQIKPGADLAKSSLPSGNLNLSELMKMNDRQFNQVLAEYISYLCYREISGFDSVIYAMLFLSGTLDDSLFQKCIDNMDHLNIEKWGYKTDFKRDLKKRMCLDFIDKFGYSSQLDAVDIFLKKLEIAKWKVKTNIGLDLTHGNESLINNTFSAKGSFDDGDYHPGVYCGIMGSYIGWGQSYYVIKDFPCKSFYNEGSEIVIESDQVIFKPNSCNNGVIDGQGAKITGMNFPKAFENEEAFFKLGGNLSINSKQFEIFKRYYPGIELVKREVFIGRDRYQIDLILLPSRAKDEWVVVDEISRFLGIKNIIFD